MTPVPRFDYAAALPSLDDLGRVHVLAIGGAGMSAVARLLLARGVGVSGSDRADSRALRALEAEGATVRVGHDAAHIEGVDTVVVSSAIPDDNVELVAARERGLRVLHRSQALAVLTEDRTRIAVAGANGKTTTTSMITVALAGAGRDPSYACGGEIAQLGRNAAWGSGPEAVIEADESDGSFVVYRPHIAVVTSVQPDHLDYYGTVAQVRRAYAQFVETVAQDGLLIACADDQGARELAAAAVGGGRRVLTYGWSASADLRLGYSTSSGMGTRTVIFWGGQEHVLELAVPGEHNILNASAAYLVLTEGLGVQPEEALAPLAGFTGARRRFEVIGTVGGVTVVDDYAHNAPKVEALVRTARALASTSSLRVIFQPHLYSRTRDFAEGFAQALAPADVVVLLDIYGAREQPVPGVTSELIGERLRGLPGERLVSVGVAREEAVALVTAQASPGDLVLVVGAGDVTVLAPAVVQALGEERGARA